MIANDITFAVTTFIILLLLLIVMIIPFFVRYSQNFLMYRNKFGIKTDRYKAFWEKISFYNSILLTYRLYYLQR